MADAVRDCRVTVCDLGHSFETVHERTCAVRALMKPALAVVVVAVGGQGEGDASMGETGDIEEAGVLRETTLVFVGHWLEREGNEERTGREGPDGAGAGIVLDMHKVGGTGRRVVWISFGGRRSAADEEQSGPLGGPGGTSLAHA